MTSATELTLKLTVLVDNAVGRPLPLLGEHGFACLLDCAAGRILFDTGRGTALLHNLDVLGIPAASIDAVVLSHGHDDHGGGLLPLLQRIGPRPVYAHPGVFTPRAFVAGSEERSIGLAHDREELESAGARFRLHAEFAELAHGLWFSGYIPRRSKAERSDPQLVVPRADGEGGWHPDPLADDAALAVATSQGVVLLLGCAHAGVINTVEHMLDQLDGEPLHALIGGTHLGPASEEQFESTVAYLAGWPGLRIGVGHCTGPVRSARLHARFPDRTFFATAGTVFEA